MVANAGRLRANGATIKINDGAVTFQRPLNLEAGALIGSDTIVGNIVNTGGTIAPCTSAGSLVIDGDLTLGAGGVLDLELGGIPESGNFDAITVTGFMTLGGTLKVAEIDGFFSRVGDIFVVMTCARGAAYRSGPFIAINPFYDDTYSLPIEQDTSVFLEVTARIRSLSGIAMSICSVRSRRTG